MRLGFFVFWLFSIFGFTVYAQQLGDFIYSSDTSIQQDHVLLGMLWYKIYQLHIQLWEQSMPEDIILVQNDVLRLIDTIKTLSTYRVIDAMQHSQNKSEIFNSYLLSLESALYSSNASQNQLESEIWHIIIDRDDCVRQKKTSDKSYLNAINLNATQDIDKIVLSSQESASCIAKQNTLLSIKQSLLDKLVNESNKIWERYDYLLSEKQSILDYFDLLDSTYLIKVIDIQKHLEKGGY